MARTAPVPNIPPIPGMCPSVAVLAGGGDGGGGGGNGAGGGNGEGPGNGNGSGDAAAGDERGAGSCGTGSSGDCTNCGNQMSAGDPIDIGTGRVFTVPAYDLTLPGPLPFAFRRKYSSTSRRRDVGLGPGWVHSFAWEVTVHRSRIDLWDGDGVRTELPILAQGAEATARKQRRLRRDAEGYVLSDDGFERYFKVSPNDASRFVLAHVRDRNNNTITLEYASTGALARITDCVGRTILVGADPRGHLTFLAVHNALSQGQLVYAARYDYDEAGHLTRVTDAAGYPSDYGYDERDRLVWHRLAGSPTFHFVYDDVDRCIESWGAYPDKPMPGLAEDSGLLADNQTVAKGVLHVKVSYSADGYVELVDSVRVRRFFVNEDGKVTKGVAGGGVTSRTFDDSGNLVTHQDALGAVTQFQWDEQGRLARVTNPLGEFEQIRRDAHGRPLEHRDGVGLLVRFAYDPRGNVDSIEASLNDRATYRYNDRGMPIERTRPDGGTIRIEYDVHQNPIRLTNPDGTTWRWIYDYRGRLLKSTDQLGQVKAYEYDERGLLTALHEPNGGSVRFTYDAARDCVAVSDALGTTRGEYNGTHKMTKFIHPDGTFAQFLYNREGFLLELRNERLEVQRIEHNHMGLVTKVTGYDGGEQHYRLDAMGRLVTYRDQLGHVTKYDRDALGRVTSIEYPDGAQTAFQYDLRGNVVQAKGGGASLVYEVDAAGQILRETQEVGGVIHSVDRAYDVMRQRTLTRTSLGFEEERVLDDLGRMRELKLGPNHVLSFDYDARGQALSIGLPGGAAIKNRWDPVGALLQRSVTTTGHEDDHEVEWVGAERRGATVDKSFRYSLNALLVSRSDLDFGSQEYTYDKNDRVTERRVRGKLAEAFRYDQTNNVYEATGGRTYGPADRLLRKDKIDYEWDRAGRLSARVVHEDTGPERTTFVWNGAGHLARVKRPDGTVVEFAYDAFGRRTHKRLVASDAVGRPKTVSSTRFVWVGPRLAHEIRTRAEASGDPIVEERTYVYDDRGHPLAHKTVRPGGQDRDVWVYYVNDGIGTPEHLVDGSGKVVGTLERTTWGEVTAKGIDTPIRFYGQYEDEETGLYYNRYRYYDPDTGRYISEDPAGGLPDLNQYRYCTNPVGGVDPLGLQHQATYSFTPGNGSAPTRSGSVDSTFCDDTREDMQDPTLTRPNADGTPRQYDEGACFSAFCRERFSDTEAKIIRDVNENTTPAERRGSTLQIHGQRPPCFACRGRMEQFAQENRANVEYSWGPGANGQGSFTSDFRTSTPASQRGTAITGMAPGTRSDWRPTATGR